MAYYIHLILILFIGGASGWTLFFIVVLFLNNIKTQQITMIKDIKEDILHIKSEIKELK
jgi:hypothetical protein